MFWEVTLPDVVRNSEEDALYIPVRRLLGSNEVAQLIAACATPRQRLVILALLETGLSASELSRLERDSVNHEDGTLRVVGRQDPVPASPLVLDLLSQEFQSRSKLPLGIRQVQRIVQAVARQAGLSTDVTPDVLRRTWLQTSGPAHADSGNRSKRLLESAADAALDILLVADDQGRYVDLNRAAAALLGLPREKIIGRRIEDFFSEAKGQAVPEAWRSFLGEGEQRGFCQLRSAPQRTFEYRARAHFKPGFHVSILREIPAANTGDENEGG